MPGYDFKNDFRALQILHASFVAGVTLFGLIVLFLLSVHKNAGDGSMETIFNYVVSALAISGILIGNTVFKKRSEQVAETSDLKTKFDIFRSACILRYAMLEGPALFAVIAAYVTGSRSYLVGALLLVLLMIMAAPKKKPVARILGVGEDTLGQ